MGLGKEPNIVINGTVLTVAEAMTIRVAVGSFAISLQEGADPTPEITKGYLNCIGRIHELMHKTT